MSWQTLRDGLHAKMASVIGAPYTALGTSVKDGLFTAVAQAVVEETGGGAGPVVETCSWTQRTFSAIPTAWEDSGRVFGFSGYYLPTVAEIDAQGRFHIQVDSSGDLWANDFTGQKVFTTITHPVTSYIKVSTIAQFPAPGQWCRAGAFVFGHTPEPDTRAWMGIVLEKNGGNYWVRGVYSEDTYSGVLGGYWGTVDVDESHIIAGVEVELTVTASGKATGRFRKVGNASWTSLSGSHMQPGLELASVFVGNGHSSGWLFDLWLTAPVITIL